jgi:hypothetical protein
MQALSAIRWFLLVASIVTFLTGTVLYWPMRRHILDQYFRLSARLGGRPVRFPPPLVFLLDHEWLGRAYHLCFAGLLLGVWWYLGTAAGAAHWAQWTAAQPR